MRANRGWAAPPVKTNGPLGDLAEISHWYQDTSTAESSTAEDSTAEGSTAEDSATADSATEVPSADTATGHAALEPLPVVVGDPAAAVTAAAVCAVLVNRDAASLTADQFDDADRLDHQQWMSVCSAIRDRIRELEPLRDDLDELLLAAAPAFSDCVAEIRSAGQDHRPILIDGPVAAAAALIAHEQSPDVLNWLRPIQLGGTPTETLSWDYLRVTPILAIHTRIADGSLAGLANATVQTAVSLASRISADQRGSADTNGGLTTSA